MYFVTIKYPGRRAMSYHEFDTFEKAVTFSTPKVGIFNISICSDEGTESEKSNLREIVSFKVIK